MRERSDITLLVFGNHDHWADTGRSQHWLSQSGQDLRHKIVPIDKNGSRIWLVGAGDLWEDHKELDELLSGIPESDCRIVLAHNPDTADTEFLSRVDLMICGHTHGGQVSIPFVGTPVLPVRNKTYSSVRSKTSGESPSNPKTKLELIIISKLTVRRVSGTAVAGSLHGIIEDCNIYHAGDGLETDCREHALACLRSVHSGTYQPASRPRHQEYCVPGQARRSDPARHHLGQNQCPPSTPRWPMYIQELEIDAPKRYDASTMDDHQQDLQRYIELQKQIADLEAEL